MTLYLLKFNNYYNRQVKVYSGLSAYTNDDFLCAPFAVSDRNPITDVNFIPNDGVITEQNINWQGENPNYILVVDNYNIIVSRWYVVDSTKLRDGQFKLTLHRDLLVDYYEEIINSPMFVEKGYTSINDNAIFNSENIDFNQIKKSETLLKDDTGTAWVVGYCAAPVDGETDKPIEYGALPIPDYYTATIEDWDFYDYIDNPSYWLRSATYGFYFTDTTITGKTTWIQKFNTLGPVGNYETVSGNNHDGYKSTSKNRREKITPRVETVMANHTDIDSVTRRFIGGEPTRNSFNKLRDMHNSVLKVGADTYYRIVINDIENPTVVEKVTVAPNSTLGIEMTSIINDINAIDNDEIIDGSAGDNSYEIEYTADKLYIELKLITPLTGLTFDFPADRPVLKDAPYCMFCLPYGDYEYVNEKGVYTTANKENALTIATAIAEKMDSAVYDIQLLPYAPIELLRTYGLINLQADTYIKSNLSYVAFEEADQVMFFADRSIGSFRITNNYYIPSNSIRFKVQSETKMFRLCSPNYSAQFEFSPFKNRGTNYIQVDYAYKPYQPYIHLAINFKDMYGKEFGDARGLICSGNFSLTRTASAFANYELNNKNFNEIFKREIDSMDLRHEIQANKELAQIVSGSLTAGVQGAVGGMVGFNSPFGALAGLATAGISAAAGYKDRQFNTQLREEEKNYYTDMHDYQIANIKAIPNTLTGVSAFNPNNKIFPLIEEYEATPEEIKAFENRLIYNGMTINRIGTLREFIEMKPSSIEWGFFKGQLIRMDTIDENSRITNAIASELNKGVYIV